MICQSRKCKHACCLVCDELSLRHSDYWICHRCLDLNPRQRRIDQLSDRQIIALAKDAGLRVNPGKFHLEHVRGATITRLQELSDKGLLERRAFEAPGR